MFLARVVVLQVCQSLVTQNMIPCTELIVCLNFTIFSNSCTSADFWKCVSGGIE